MMTVKEMHVDVRDQLQRLSANRNRKLEDDQLDWNLNRAQQMMVEGAVEPIKGSNRFSIKSGKSDIVTGLLSGRVPVFASWVTDRYISFLPPDLWYLLDDASSVVQLCTGESKITTYTVLNITSVQFPYSTNPAGYYSSINLIYNNSTLIDLTAFLLQRQKQYQGMASVEEHFYIKNILQELLIDKGIMVYWERFNNLYQPYTFLFVSTGTAVPISLVADSITYTGTNQQLTLEVHAGTRVPKITTNTMISPDRGMATHNTPYFRTSYISPVSELGPSILYTYRDESFIVCQTTVSYVRKPRTISLSLGTDCQLSPTIHQQLCNRTVEMILNRIDDPAWEGVAKQNVLAGS